MSSLRNFAVLVCIGLLACASAFASHLVTGNGFGFGVVVPHTGVITKFYAHPYSFLRPDPSSPLSEGIPTANFLKSLLWSGGPARNASADYIRDSQVIQIRRSDGAGLCFMPFGFSRAALIVSWQPNSSASRRGAFRVEWNAPIQSQKTLLLSGIQMHLLTFAGIPENLLLIPLNPSRTGSAWSPQLLSGSRAWALLSLASGDNPKTAAAEFLHWQAGLSPAALAAREISELEQWRVKPAVLFASQAERHLWRQSEVMLRMAQCREPNRPGRYGNGLIVASLPDGVWFTPWVRDMAWATVALARMGHQREARAALLAYFNARPTGLMRAQTNNADYQVSVVRYFGNGEEEPFFTDEGSTNIEFDDWGEVLWALGEYLHSYHDSALLSTPTYRGTLYQSARDFIVKPLLANTEPFANGRIVRADTSIWEEREKDKKHFAFSTAAAIVGLREFAQIARLTGDPSARADALHQAILLQKGFNAAFIRSGQLHGALEPGIKNDIDGALLQIINWGVVTNPAVIRNTVRRMALLKVASGGYRRVRSTYTDPAIFEYWYERQEFLFVDFNLAELDRRLGNTAAARAMLARIVRKAAADHNILPEMYVALPCKLFPGKIGDPTGALPMVGYGSGEYIIHLLNRESMNHLN